MSVEEIERKQQDFDESLSNQQTELVKHAEQIRSLKEQHAKEIGSLQDDVKKLAELVWCGVHRVMNQSLARGGIDARHVEMALELANKHGVAFAGSQE